MAAQDGDLARGPGEQAAEAELLTDPDPAADDLTVLDVDPITTAPLTSAQIDKIVDSIPEDTVLEGLTEVGEDDLY